ncbi:MAG: electron transfer flavoprotein subunit beta/FixA family protein [Candidatus Latescibacteria bacterium]|nr:electron transfer flavoprotein subunit beta/FixA family protein [Candidatus Latescibacterota bacterium]
MNIVVFVKQVPDTETRIQLKDGVVDTSSVKWVANPYDEFAIEEGLRIRERLGQGKVTVVSLGPDRVKEAIKYALSLGADEGVHVKGDEVALSDPLAVATVLAAAARKLGFDLILTGKQGVDHDWSQVGVMLAEILDLPHVSVVVHLEVDPDAKKGKAKREVEGGAELLEFDLPAVITAQKGLNEPRYASLKGIMAVKKKVIPEWSPADLGLDPASLAEGAATIRFVDFALPPPRPAGRILEGDPADTARELVRLLREEAKVI